MMKTNSVMHRAVGLAAVLAALLLMSSTSVRAHCDAVNGPVAAAARKALETEQFRPIAIWVGKAQETELRKEVETWFQKARAARAQKDTGPQAGREWVDAYVKYVIYVHGLHNTIYAGPKHGVGD